MSSDTSTMGLDASSLNCARELVCHLEAGHYEFAEAVIRKLCKKREDDLFQEIGKLTRELHESLNSFNEDSRFKTMMSENIPDAKERIDYVIKTMEQSTHRTLDAIEHCMPLVNGFNEKSTLLQIQLQDFMKSDADKNNLNVIKDMDEYLSQVVTDTKNIHSDLSDVLMAQGYQDITGQVLQRVINLVQEVEKGLVGMLCVTSQAAVGEVEKTSTHDNAGYGPAVPGVTKDTVIQDQADVDDLLSTLGF